MTVITQSAASALGAQLRVELLQRITQRLDAGHSLVRRRHFGAAIEAAYRDFTGRAPPEAIRGSLLELVDAALAEHPEAFQARGAQNAVAKAFGHGVVRLAWDEARVQAHGTASVCRFLRRHRIRGLLHEIRIDPRLIDVTACVRHGAALAGKRPAPTSPAVRPSPAAAASAPAGVTTPESGSVWAQAFTALQHLVVDLEPLLRLLVRHHQHVVGGAGDRTSLMTELLRSPESLDLALRVMDGGDPELQRLVQRQPPFDAVAPEPLSQDVPLTVTEAFIGQLRRGTPSAFAAAAQSADAATARKARDDLRGVIHLIDHLLAPTPFRMKVRLLLASRTLKAATPVVEGFYGGAGDLAAARAQIDDLLEVRLRQVLAGAGPAEAEAVRRRARALRMTVEQKLDLQAEANPAADGPQDAAPAAATEDDTLSEIEVRRGAQRVPVAVRVDGAWQRITATIIPSADDARRFVMARRDPDSGELAAETRRRRPRFVDRRPDGSWQALTG